MTTSEFLTEWFSKPVRPRVVVLGNQKGGSGKSTTAIHTIVGLMGCGYAVGSIDLDGHQATLTHFIENRKRYAASTRAVLAMPEHRMVANSTKKMQERAERDETERVAAACESLIDMDYIVIDTPGQDTFISRLGHILADTLITPLNDSFMDLDVLVRIDPIAQRITGPSTYSIAVMDRWGLRVLAGGAPIDWMVVRNRLAHLYTRNHQELERVLQQVAPKLGFRLGPGFGERVIYRELFLRGLTILDQTAISRWGLTGRSHMAAREEVWALLKALGLAERGDETRRQPQDELAISQA